MPNWSHSPLLLPVPRWTSSQPTWKYSLEKFGGGNQHALDDVHIEIELYNEEGLIHTFSGITEDGKLRYGILARETDQDGTLWMINNLYTVYVSASLDGQTVTKAHEYYGIANYDQG